MPKIVGSGIIVDRTHHRRKVVMNGRETIRRIEQSYTSGQKMRRKILPILMFFVIGLFTQVIGCGEDEDKGPEAAKIIKTRPASGGEISLNGSLTIQFDKPVTEVKVNAVSADVTDSKAVWEVVAQEVGRQFFKIQWVDENGNVGSTDIMLTVFYDIITMTYNILNGASVDPEIREWMKMEQSGYQGNRLPRILEVVKFADPDILGIQEAHKWEIGDPSVAEQVADQLGMYFFFGQSTKKSGASVVLFSKFPIQDAENYSSHFTRAGLRAQVMLPTGQALQVCVVHLDVTSSQIRMSEVSFVAKEMRPYIDDLAIIMGDMNFIDGSEESTVLHNAGWQLRLDPTSSWIDQIWISPVLAPYVEPGPVIPQRLIFGTSDHMPFTVTIGIPGTVRNTN